ncbi:MAG: amidohydrolase family protein [Bacteroidota bacterium]
MNAPLQKDLNRHNPAERRSPSRATGRSLPLKRRLLCGVIVGCLICGISACYPFPPSGGYEANISPIADEYLKTYLAEESGKIALTHATIIDGTGSPPATDQTILIHGQQIVGVGKSPDLELPAGFREIDATGKTVIPGIVGTHNHMRLPRAAMLYSSPKLYLACGVTTIQTCGTGNPNEELGISQAIQDGLIPGPDIINSGPYFTGPAGKSNFIRFTDEPSIRDSIRYWANRGVKWFKVYRHTRPQDLAVIVDEAHQHGAKVTGHLCATTYEEAAELGIDAIEHGFIHSFDHVADKPEGICGGSLDFRSDLDIDSEEVKAVHQVLIKHGVGLSTTPSIFDAQARGMAEERALELMAPVHLEAHHARQIRRKEQGENWYFKEEWLRKSLAYDLAFFKAGGLLTAGPDPGWHNLPGIGDQKNYELFIEGEFQPEEAIQIMTANGARLLDLEDRGRIEAGLRADLVVLEGDLTLRPEVIREVEMVVKSGIVFDPDLLIKGLTRHVGSERDNDLRYLGQRPPTLEPELFAPGLLSKPGRYEFGSVFSKDGKECFFAVELGHRAHILHTKLVSGVWSQPEIIPLDTNYSFNDPMLNPEEDRLYFISTFSPDGTSPPKDYDIWYVERQGDSWSDPINAGESINSSRDEYYISFSEDGSMYFGSNKLAPEDNRGNFDIFRAQMTNGSFEKAIPQGKGVNSPAYEADVCVAPDESYMIFCATRKEGYGRGDLYISFRDDQGNWTQAKNMGPEVNDKGHQLCPFISVDGAYIFFTSNQDIYWVDAGMIEAYK